MNSLPAHVRAMTTCDSRPGAVSEYQYRDHHKKTTQPNPHGKGYRVNSGPKVKCKGCGFKVYQRSMDEYHRCKVCQSTFAKLAAWFQATTGNMKGSR